MEKKENIKGNDVKASLYVGVGGIGGKIIRKVVRLAKNDDLSKARFVIMDTDVNDLERADGEAEIVQIQTSSPRTIRDYLLQDDDAREEWFPNNMIINSKTVSEGAGQVRSISRLALNATIRTGRINALYRAIDDLYDKDGRDKKQTIKVTIASTVAGGTGSGIAMIVAMLIRNYIADNYPDSSAIIRGFLLLPSVMDTFDPSASEKLSLQRNGYATIKEINAFMMRPFFEAVPELRRYLSLGVDVPNSSGGVDRLTCSPFDFCFLYDRTDSNVCNMSSMDQYQEYAAHSIYELCMGPMSAKASSKEDNIHKEFLDDKKLSRNRFGGAGASVVRYPYKKIRDYIAYEWMEKQLIGFTSDQVDESQTKQLVSNGWIAYDKKFFEAMREYENNPAGKTKPSRSESYTTGIDTGSDELSKQLREIIKKKNDKYKNEEKSGAKKSDGNNNNIINSELGTIVFGEESATIPVAVRHYIAALVKQVAALHTAPYSNTVKSFRSLANYPVSKTEFSDRYDAIDGAKKLVNPGVIASKAQSFIDNIFNGNVKMQGGNVEPFMLEAFLTIDGQPLHPNVMRYFLYKFFDAVDKMSQNEPDPNYKERFDTILLGKMDKDKNERDASSFQVFGNGREDSLEGMCKSCDDAGTEGDRTECNKKLTGYAASIISEYNKYATYYVCLYAKTYVERMVGKFEEFYNQFEGKIKGLSKRKKAILSDLAFENGDCEYNLFSNEVHLKKLASEQMQPQSGGQDENDLFAGIYNGIKFNTQKAEIIKNNAFSDETEDDIFDEIMVKQFRKMVENGTDLDMDIVRACGLEHQVKCLCEADETPNEEAKEELNAKAVSSKEKNVYLAQIIKKGKELACPSIIRKDFEEERAVDAMAYNKYIEEGDGMKMDDKLFSVDYASDTVSKYELRFYRSIYNLTPTQLQKFCAPQDDPGRITDFVDAKRGTATGIGGTYFSAYQEYMRKIGPDNRINPVITPHIDKRWNSITVLPELDPLEYQRSLMKRIHKAMIYGFIFQIIEKRMTSKYDSEKLVYEFIDGRNGPRKFIVSNHTKCDRLFEVLDSLYFDRYAVHSIHDTVDRKRKKEYEESTAYEDTTFAKYLTRIDRTVLMDIKERRVWAEETLKEKTVSLFEIPIFYWNSLPKKDESEIGIMVDAIFDILEKEIATFASKDDFAPLVAEAIVQHYNIMYDNFKTCPKVYIGDSSYVEENSVEDIIKNDVVAKVIRKKVIEKLDGLDVSKGNGFTLVDATEKDELFV